MQTNSSRRTQPPQAPRVPVGHQRYAYDMNDRRTLIVLAVLCALVPPVGIIMLWRAERITLPVRGGLTLLALAAMTLIFFFILRPDSSETDITPMPAAPQYAGYGYIASDTPVPTQAPVPPAVVPMVPSGNVSATAEPGGLTDESIVYAVTNNASSYHLSQICGFQENNRALTLLEALNEGLQPCENCVGAAG